MKTKKLFFLLLFCPLVAFGQINIGGLTTTPISQTGAEKIPMSGPGNPATTISNLSDWVFGNEKLIHVEYNSISDQAGVIQAAIDAADPGDILRIGAGVVRTVSNILIEDKPGLKIIPSIGTRFDVATFNGTVFTFGSNSDGCTFRGGEFFSSSGKDSGLTNQTAINTGTNESMIIQNVRAAGLGGTAFKINNSANFHTNVFETLYADTCNIGFDAQTYAQLDNCHAVACNTGKRFGGGNIVVNGGTSNNCGVALEFYSAANNGKVIINGYQANHVSSKLIDINNAGSVIIISNSSFLTGGSIDVDDAAGVLFISCNLTPTSLNFDSGQAQDVEFAFCFINGDPPVTGLTTGVTYTTVRDENWDPWSG